VGKLVDIQFPSVMREISFTDESLVVALRNAADSIDAFNASEAWDEHQEISSIVVFETYIDDDESLWTVSFCVPAEPMLRIKQKEIEDERNLLLRRIAELEGKLGLAPWWMEDSE
jgi:hypothetical protein